MEMNIPLNAEVHCQDGICGDSVRVIIDPRTQQVTHFVVRKRKSPRLEKLVPGALVSGTTLDTIDLCLRSDELANMEDFKETRFDHVDVETSKMAAVHNGSEGIAYWPSVNSKEQTVSLEKERLPRGELAIRRGIEVFATDGPAGKVGEFLVDSEDGHITHMIMRTGHLWNQREITVPVAQIDRIDQNRVFLHLDKRHIKTLPATLLRQWI